MSIEAQISDPICETARVYQLGRVVFTLKNCDSKYEEALNSLLPHFAGSELPDDRHEVNTGCSKDVTVLIRHTGTVHHQKKCVWIEASCVIAPNGKKVLITGPAKSGKTTTAVALALGQQWKVLAENYCIIDYDHGKFLKFLAPAALDDKSIEILKRNEITPEPTLQLEWRTNRVWSPTTDVIGDTTYEPNWDLAIWLERDEQSTEELAVDSLTTGEFGRKIMPVSNLLKLPNSYESFLQSLAHTRCVKLTNGELEARSKFIVDAVNV
ncbi:MAG: hypothetical protein JST89_16895 [Cyanobacteria bacterium SZAS-4]|nr:hypothetical protein [Cyanobacteria bacterium SZAS-4]